MGIFHRNHDDRNFFNPAVLVHDGKDFHAVFFGHDHVEKHQGDFVGFLSQENECFVAVFGFKNIVFVTENVGQQCSVQGHIVNNKYKRALFIHVRVPFYPKTIYPKSIYF